MKQRGFTIIEVALVLAIAGLIFLVVFLALPALQNSQKDTARKQDVARVVSALQAYEADHQGDLPAVSGDPEYPSPDGYPSDGSSSSGFSGYLGKLDQTKYIDIASVGWLQFDANGRQFSTYIEVFPSAQCIASSIPNAGGGETTVAVATTSQSDAAVAVLLSSGTAYCANM